MKADRQAHSKDSADAWSWKRECREALYQLVYARSPRSTREVLEREVIEALETLELEMQHHAKQLNRDGDDVFMALAVAVRNQAAHELFEPKWTKRRNKGYDSVENAIRELRAVLRDRDLGNEVNALVWELDELRTAEYPPSKQRLLGKQERLERELQSVKDALDVYHDRSSHPIDWNANTRARLLSRDRVSMKWTPSAPKGGSPPTRWLRDARKQLREAGVSSDGAIEGMLKAVGIMRPYRKTSRKK